MPCPSMSDCYLKNIVNLPGRPGFSNSLESGDISQWWTQREDPAAEKPQVIGVFGQALMWLMSGRASGRKSAAPILFINIPGKGVL